MSTTLQCPNLVAYNSVERVCLLGKFPAGCAACTCPDKHIVEATATTMGTLNPPHDTPSPATMPSPASVPVTSAAGQFPSPVGASRFSREEEEAPIPSPAPDSELERAADGYAWSHDTIGVHRETFATTDVPPDKMVRVPVADEIRTAVLFGARWQQHRDAELIRRAHMQGMERMREQLLQETVIIDTSMMNDKPDTDFSDLRTWKYIVDAILTKEDGIGNYLDSARTEAIAKELQERFGKIEQKPAFKVGDWIIIAENHNSVYQIERIDNYRYYLRHYLGGTLSVHFDNESIRLWTIRDAKKGDILEFVDHGRLVVGIVSFVNERTGKVDVSCLLEDNKFKIGNFYALDTINPHPATKEQRDTLLKAMTDAGYTFDFEKKELKNT